MTNEHYTVTPNMMGRELIQLIINRFDWYKTLYVEALGQNRIRFIITLGSWHACEEIQLSPEQLESNLDDLSGEVLVPLAKRFIRTMLVDFNTKGGNL